MRFLTHEPIPMNDPHDDTVESPLLREKEWAEHQVIDYVRQQLSAQLAPLSDTEQLNYRNVLKQYADALIAVERESENNKDAFEVLGLQMLKERLLALTGKHIDPHNLYLHTRYLHVPDRHARRETGSPVSAELLPEPVPIRDEREPTVHVLSMSLWQAACLNFGFLAYFASFRSGSLIEASYIDEHPGGPFEQSHSTELDVRQSLIDVKTFVDVVRELDLGSMLKERLTGAMTGDSALTKRLKFSIQAQLQFSLMELYRTSASNPAVRKNIKAFAAALEEQPNRLIIKRIFMLVEFTYLERLSGHGFNPQTGLSISKAPGAETETSAHHIHIPLFQIHHQGRAGFFSFFPGRPGGELKFHTTEKQLVADFKSQFIAAHTEKDLEWFDSTLTPQMYKKFTEITRIETSPKGLTPLAQWLYDSFKYIHNKKPIEAIDFKSVRVDLTLEEALYQFSSAVYISRLEQLATQRFEQDWEDLKGALTTLFDETMGLLLTPVPGSLKGLNRMVRYLLVGVSGYGLIRGVEQAAKGQHIELLNAMVNMLDVLINVPLHTSLGKRVYRRHRKLLNYLGNPRALTRPDGQTELWYPDPARYIAATPRVIEGMSADEQGIYNHEGHHYVVLEKDNDAYVVEVERQQGSQRHILVHPDDSVFRPEVVFDATTRRWQLLLDDSSALSNEQLLSRMLPGLPVSEARVLLNISSVNRAVLDAAWAGGVVPASLNDAITRFQADDLIDRITREPGDDENRIIALERPVLALLTQLDEWPNELSLKVFDSSGNLSEEYAKQWHRASFSRSIELRRLFDGQLVPNVAKVFKAFPVDTFTEIIKQLPASQREATSLSQALRLKIKQDRAAIFKSLTTYKAYLRSDRALTKAQDKVYYPVVLGSVDPASGMTKKLHELHPQLSEARCMELIRQYPSLEHSLPSAISSEALRNRLQGAVERAVFSDRVESLLDSIYHPRPFNSDADKWIREVCKVVLKRDFHITLAIYDEASGADISLIMYDPNNKVLLQHYGDGEYGAFDLEARAVMPKETGLDSFFTALIKGISSLSRVENRLLPLLESVSEWRWFLAEELVKHRTQDGYLNLPVQKNEDYADSNVKWSAAIRPFRSGHFALGKKLYIVIEGHAYPIQHEVYGYKASVTHPDMFARAPLQAYGNGEGAWRFGNENPLVWEGQQLFRRFGYAAFGFNPDQVGAILKISGTPDDVLRRIHLYADKPPALLADTLQRFTNYRRLQTLLEHRATDTDQAFMARIFNAFEDFERAGLLATMTDEHKKTLEDLFGKQIPASPWLSEDEHAQAYIQVVYHVLKHSSGTMTPALFELINRVTEYRTDPSVALLQRVFTRLPVAVAEDLIRHATDAEALQMSTHGRVPLRLAQEARWYVRELRINRVLEGFYWPALQNNDSVKLLLRAFEQQPGWPTDCHIDVREGTAIGPLISQLGPDSAGLQLNIIKMAGSWHVYGAHGKEVKASGHDLFNVVLAALPVYEREALGYTYAGGDALLKEQLTIQVTEHRELARQVLGMRPERPWFNTPKRLADGRLGYELSGRGAAGSSLSAEPLVARYRALYPLRREAQAAQDIKAMRDRGLDAGAEVSLLETQLARLVQQLEMWVYTQPQRAPHNPQEQEYKRLVARRLTQAWRKETEAVVDVEGRVQGYRLDLHGLRVSTLPELDVSFSHVCSLSIAQVGLNIRGHENINQFLQNFGALTSLDLQRCGLNFYPTVIGQMRHLTNLSLSNNVVTMDVNDLNNLTQLTQLRVLNLSGCWLLAPLNVSGMTALRTLNLARTGASGWPVGVLGLAHLTSLDLSNNEISEVPVAVLNEPEHERINRVTLLIGNPLSVHSEQRLQAYQGRTGIAFGLHHEAVHPALAQYDSQAWTGGLPDADRAALQTRWDGLQAEPGSENFFELLENLKTTADFEKANEDLVQRVRGALEAAAQDEALRSSLFNLAAGRGNCCDSTAFIFSTLETEVLVFEALRTPDPARAEQSLVKLRRGQFRLSEVDRLAKADARARASQAMGVDELEIILGYRLALKETLQLPGQPKNMRFLSLGKVDVSVIEAAQSSILARNNSDEMLSFMVEESFWVDFLEKRYPERFAVNTAQKLVVDFESLQIVGEAGVEASLANFEQWKRDRSTLLKALTRDALAALDLPSDTPASE